MLDSPPPIPITIPKQFNIIAIVHCIHRYRKSRAYLKHRAHLPRLYANIAPALFKELEYPGVLRNLSSGCRAYTEITVCRDQMSHLSCISWLLKAKWTLSGEEMHLDPVNISLIKNNSVVVSEYVTSPLKI